MDSNELYSNLERNKLTLQKDWLALIFGPRYKFYTDIVKFKNILKNSYYNL